MSISFKQLRYFTKTVEAGNITKAAEQLNLAQTALGVQIRNLEESLRVQLLTRHSRGISTTEAGRIFYERSVSILQSLAEAKRDVMVLAGTGQEEVTLGVTPSILRLVGPDLLVSAREELKGMSVRLVEALSFSLVDTLLRGDLHLALAYEVADDPGLTRIPLIEEELLFITSKERNLGNGPVSFANVASSELALASDRDIVWRMIHETADRLSLPVNIAFTVQSVQAIKTLVSRGIATSVVPYGIVAEEISKGQIVAWPIERPKLKRTLYLVRPSGLAHFTHEAELVTFLDRIVQSLTEKIGPYATVIENGPASSDMP